MSISRRLSAAIVAIALAAIVPVLAQTVTPTAGTVTVTATPNSGKASVLPTVTWSTTPAASSCAGSGGSSGGASGWSATLGPSGSYTPPAALITTQTYTVTCTWSDNAVTLSWNPPTENTDGTPLTNLASYNVYSGPASPPGKIVASPAAGVTSYTITGLPAGTNYFAVTAVNSAQQESTLSNIVAKSTAATSSASATVTVTVVPVAPVLTGK